MKKYNQIIKCAFFLFAVISMSGCKENDDIAIKDVYFSVNADGYSVAYTNTTTDAKSYKWDFGDGSISTDVSPVHVYKTKGKFVTTLYATLNNGEVISGSTIVNVSKTSPIKLDDNSLADWDAISQYVVVSGANSGIVQKAKFDYDSQNIYIYMEFKGKISDGNIFDFYLDTDGNSSTGLLTGSIPGGGYDYLLEGPMLQGADALIQYQHTGAQNSFSFSPQSIPEYYKLGTVVESNGVVKFEMALVRSKIGGLTGKSVNLGIIMSDSGWNEVGYMPDQGASAISLDISQ